MWQQYAVRRVLLHNGNSFCQCRHMITGLWSSGVKHCSKSWQSDTYYTFSRKECLPIRAVFGSEQSKLIVFDRVGVLPFNYTISQLSLDQREDREEEIHCCLPPNTHFHHTALPSALDISLHTAVTWIKTVFFRTTWITAGLRGQMLVWAKLGGFQLSLEQNTLSPLYLF